MHQLQLPNEAISVLIRQGGSEDLIKKHFWLNRLYSRAPINRKKLWGNGDFISAFFERKIKEVNDYATQILRYAPENFRSVLDVGCGLGLVDLVLYKMRNGEIDCYLLDKTNRDIGLRSVGGGFHKEYIFTADLELSKEIFITNGAKPDKVHLVSPDNEDIGKLENIDLIISLTSWGFHYPIQTYWAGVSQCMSESGVLLLDIRNKTGAFDFLAREFKYHCLIADEETRVRAAFSNQPIAG